MPIFLTQIVAKETKHTIAEFILKVQIQKSNKKLIFYFFFK